ncbi:pilus assembly protein PilP [Comamonas sp. GB3 AK4-5]|uniref:pilus assembly protein PilP n=1 Tax=Comamonas sp. GB3 AK4-5 TaxID=3231487 RepID=UPI00351E9C99
MRRGRCLWTALLLAGCSGAPEGDVQAWLLAQRAAARPSIVPLTAPRLFQPRSYMAEPSVDPFDVAKLHRGGPRDTAGGAPRTAQVSPEPSRRKEVLESFPLDAMVMVGSLERQGQRTALLRVEQLLYPVRAGQYLGQNHGRIVQISEDRIQLRELVQDAAGGWVEKMSTLDLQEGPP